MNREPYWFQIIGENYNNVWAPEIVFRQIVSTEIIPPYGKGVGKYDFWVSKRNSSYYMNFYQYLKITTSCNFDFNDFPFDHHDCELDFGFHQNEFNRTVRINPIKVLNHDTTATILNYEKDIPSTHLPFKFSITAKDEYHYYQYEFPTPYTGITIHMQRKSLRPLVGAFYVPTAIFSSLANISFFIDPDVVRKNQAN